LREGRWALLTGGSCRRTNDGYVVVSLNDSNKERKTSQFPRQLYWTIEKGFGFGAGPFPLEEEGLFIAGMNQAIGRSRGRAFGLQGERTAKASNCAGARMPYRVWLPGGDQGHFRGTRPGRGSRGCWAAIHCHIHGLLTSRDWGGRSGGASRARSSWTFFECGSGVVTAVAAMGGRGRGIGWDWLIVSAPGAGGILTSVRRASMVKRTDGARWVGGRASLMSVSVSPTVLKLGGLVGREGKFNLVLLREDEDSGGEGRYVLRVDGDNNRSGVLGAPRISVRVKVPG